MLRAEQEFEAELEALMEVLERSDLEAEAEMFAPAPGKPIFDVACGPCPTTGDCRALLQDATTEAIRIALNAAALLDAAVKVPPERRDQDSSQTAAIFTQVFCHDPSAFVP